MAFVQNKLFKTVNQAQDIFDEFIYRDTQGDTIAEITADGYFKQSRFSGTPGWINGLITIYAENQLFDAKIGEDSIEVLSGGGNSFAVGPAPNEFRSATLAGAMILLEAQTLAFPDWLAVYDAAPISTTSGELNVRLFYTQESINYMQLLARDNGEWVMNASFEGVVGDKGTDGIDGSGVTSSFSSLDALNSYMLKDENYKHLKTDDNSSITVDGVVFQYRWSGDNSPTSYDPLAWERAEIGTTAGSLVMGPSSIESAAQVMMYKDATGGSNYIIQSEFDNTGSKRPVYYELSEESIFDLALVDTDVLPSPMEAETVMTFQSVSDAFICKPATSGTLMYKTWIGTKASHEGEPILFERVTITPAMVGVETKISIKNPVIVNADESLYSEITGVDLYGGLQTDGPMAGQTVPFNKLHLQVVSKRPMALQDEMIDIGGIIVGDISQQGLYFNVPAGQDFAIPQAEVMGDGNHGTPFFYNATDAPQNTVVVQGIETEANTAGFSTIYSQHLAFASDYSVKYITIQVADSDLGRDLRVWFYYQDDEGQKVESESEVGSQTVSGSYLTLKLLDTMVVPTNPNAWIGVKINMTDSSGTNINMKGNDARFPYWEISEETVSPKVNLALEKDIGLVVASATDTTPKPLDEKVASGSGISIEYLDSDIVISSDGGGSTEIIDGKALGFNDEVGDLYALAQYKVNPTNTEAPFYYKADALVVNTYNCGAADTGDVNITSVSMTLDVTVEANPKALIINFGTPDESTEFVTWGLTKDGTSVESGYKQYLGGIGNIYMGFKYNTTLNTTSVYVLTLVVQDSGTINVRGAAANDPSVFYTVTDPSTLEKMPLATYEEVNPTVNEDAGTSTWTTMTAAVTRYTGTPVAGYYRIEYSCEARIRTSGTGGTSTGMGYFEMTVKKATVKKGNASCQITALGASSGDYQYGSVCGIHYIQLSGSELLDVSISASNYDSLAYRWNSCYVTRVGDTKPIN